MKKKIFLAIFLIVSMAVPAFSFYWKNYDYHNEEDLKKFKELVTKEFYLIRDEIFAPIYPEVKDVEIVWDYSEEDWENRKNDNAFYSGIERKVRIKPYITEWTTFDTELELIVIIHELSHAVSPKSGHGKEFVEIFYKMTDEFLIRVFDRTLESYMFNNFDKYPNTEEIIEFISRYTEEDFFNSITTEEKPKIKKENLTIKKLKKKLKLKILK